MFTKKKGPVPVVRANGRHAGTSLTYLLLISFDAPITFFVNIAKSPSDRIVRFTVNKEHQYVIYFC